MNDYSDLISIIIAFIWTACTWFWGSFDGFIQVLIAFVIIDYVTGVMAAAINHKLSSEEGFNGILRKLTIFFLVGIAHVVDRHLLGQGSLVREAVCCFYASNEGISILENAVKMRVPIPNTLKNILLQIKGKEKSPDNPENCSSSEVHSE